MKPLTSDFPWKAFWNNIVSSFNIYTIVSIKRLHSQYPILHQSSKSYYQPNEMRTIVTTQIKIWATC
jgi:hypothetical protein